MLKVNEIFGPTIQGEGPSQGKRVMFLRLAYCNLSCTWCDTKYTWDFKQYDKLKEVHEMNNIFIVSQLFKGDCKALVISGGEPLLQQKELIPLLNTLRAMHYWVEIETNGTIKPDCGIVNLVDQFNCSPKLSNSGDSKQRRVKADALTTLSQLQKVYFKFVVSCEKDIEEVTEYVNTYSMTPSHVYLMPLGKTQEELSKTTDLVRTLAQKHHFVFSSRLHVELYGNKRAV